MQARVMAPGAPGIPIHAAPGPMAPFARLAILRAKDVEPIVRVRIVCEIECLKASAGKCDQKLLKRVIADDARERVRFGLRGGTSGGDGGAAGEPAHFGTLVSVRERAGRIECGAV